MIKISIDGIHGSGKTILLNNIKNYLESIGKSVYLVKEIARKCPYQLKSIKSQRWIWENHIIEENIAIESNCDIILTDRTLISNLIYYKYLLKDQEDHTFNNMWIYTKRWMGTYNYISVLDMNPEFIVDDGFRITDMNKTIEINDLFIKYLKPYQNININRFNYKEIIMEIIKWQK